MGCLTKEGQQWTLLAYRVVSLVRGYNLAASGSFLMFKLDVNIYTLSAEPTIISAGSLEEKFVQTLRILPNMPLKTLRSKILKVLKARPNSNIQIYARLRQNEITTGAWGEIDLASSRQSDLTWWGIEDGGHLGVLLP